MVGMMREPVPTPAQQTVLGILQAVFDGGLAARDFASAAAARNLRYYGMALHACEVRRWVTRTWPVVAATEAPALWRFPGGGEPLPQPASGYWLRVTEDGCRAWLRGVRRERQRASVAGVAALARAEEAGRP